MAKKIDVAGRLHSVAVGNILAGADEILDDNEQKKQSQINEELIETVNYLSEEIVTKQGTITAVVTPDIEENGGSPVVISSFENGQLNFAFKNLKGDKGEDGEKGDTVILGEGQEYTLYNKIGDNTDGAMTQKAVSDAINNSQLYDWGQEYDVKDKGNIISNLRITNSGLAEAITSAYYKVMYEPVEEGDVLRIRTTSGGSVKGIALFTDIPTAGDQGEFLDFPNTSPFEAEYKIGSSGFLCVTFNGSSAFHYYVSRAEKVNKVIEDIKSEINEINSFIEQGANLYDTTGQNTDRAMTQKAVTDAINDSQMYGWGEEYDLQKADTFVSKLKISSSGVASSDTSNYKVIYESVEGGDVLKIRVTSNGSVKGIALFTDIPTAGDQGVPLAYPNTSPFEAEYKIASSGFLCVSFNGTFFHYYVSRPIKIKETIEDIKSEIEDINEIIGADDTATVDKMPRPTANPLDKIISTPSRARIFKSYGIIGASFEVAATDAYPSDFFDNGREWPTLFGKLNDAQIYNYSKSGHALYNWVANINTTRFNIDEAKPEAFIINMTPNEFDTSKFQGAAGDVSQIDPETDYTQVALTNQTDYAIVLAKVIQMCRQKSPDCYIYLATVYNYQPGNAERRQKRLEFCEVMRAMVDVFPRCYLLDIARYGMNFSDSYVASIYRSSPAAHPSRLGYIYLCDQFNTYIDWHVATHPAEYLDVAYINTGKTRTQHDIE